jgi:hypothetical protein
MWGPNPPWNRLSGRIVRPYSSLYQKWAAKDRRLQVFILKSPAWYAEVSRRVEARHGEVPIEVVDPYTFFGLINQQTGR